MSWKESWREQVKKTGEFWVDQVRELEGNINEKESALITRKKQMLNDRKAQIIKSTINGTAFDHKKVNDEDHIRYHQHLAILIQHEDESYLEEQNCEREMIFLNEDMKEDQFVERPAPEIDSPELTFSHEALERKPFHYDRQAVIQYADRWWNDYNPDYTKFDVDCTNYVSQCLRAGGAPMEHVGEKTKGWWYQNKNSYSYSWSVANALRLYLSSEGNALNAVTVDEAHQLAPGDVICYDWNGDGKWNHNAIVTGTDWNGLPLVNAHTTNSRNRYWSYVDSPAFTDQTDYLFFHIEA